MREEADVLEPPAYTEGVPDDRAVNFTRGQAIRRVLFCIVLAVSYVIDHDAIRTRWGWVSAIALWIILLFGIISFIPNIRDPDDKTSLLSRSVRVASGIGLLVAFVLKASYELSRPGLWRAAQSVQQELSPYRGPTLTLLLTGLIVLIGFAFYTLKMKNLLFYALIELAFASLSAFLAVQKAEGVISVGSFTVILASIYIIVRGFDNLKKARSRHSRDYCESSIATAAES